MMRRPLLYVLVVLVVLGCVATSHALLGARLRASVSAKRPLHIDTAIQLGTLSASGGGSADPVQLASAVQLGSVSATGGGNAYSTGIASGVTLGSVTRSINGALVNDDTFPGPSLDPSWTSFGPWDEVYGPSINNFALSGGAVQLTSNSANAGAYYAPSTADTSQVTLKALYSTTMGAFKGVTLRSGNGSATATGLGYQAYLYNYASGNYTRLAIARNGTVVLNKTVSVTTTVNHTLKAVYSGGTVTAYVDGASLGSYTDASPLPPGHPGIFINGNSSTPVNNTQLDDWSDGGGSAVLADWTTKPPAGTALRQDGHWSVTGLVGAWPLNEGSGSTAVDVVSGNNLTVQGTAVLNANGLYVDKATGSMAISSGRISALEPTAAVTMITGLKSAGTQGGYFYAAMYGTSGTSPSYGLRNTPSPSTGKLNTLAYIGGAERSGTASTLLVSQTQMDVVATRYDGAALDLVWNGAVHQSNAYTGVLDNYNTGARMCIGNRPDGASQPYFGTIYFTYVYNRALTASEIASLSANPWQIFQPH